MRTSAAVVTLALLAGSALADPPSRQAAEQLAKEAQVSPAKAVECGDMYVAVYQADPQQPHGDELLFDAAACYQMGRSVGASLVAYDLLLKNFKGSRLAPKALMASAQALSATARFPGAADRFEQYAQRYAGERDAVDAMANAITLRTALGDAPKRIADTKFFVRTWGARLPSEAGNAMFALVSAYTQPDDQVKALRDYVRTYGPKTGKEQLALAYAKIGDVLWTKSCPVAGIDGLCVKLPRPLPGQAPRCDEHAEKLDVVTRTGVRAEAATAYKQAMAIVEQAGVTDPVAVHAAAMAKVALADGDLEAMMAMAFPVLDFSDAGKAKSLAKFNTWLETMTKVGGDVSRQYEAVLALKDPESSLAATMRLGQARGAFARALVTGDIPKDIRTGDFAKDKADAYCAKMREASEPLAAKAVDAYGVCVTKAAQLGVIDHWVEACRREGMRTDAKRFPPAELVPEPVLVFPTVPAPKDAAAELVNAEREWRAGKHEAAVKQWHAALEKDPKSYVAHMNLAIAYEAAARSLPAKDPERSRLAGLVEGHAQEALALDGNPLPLAVLAAAYVQGGDPNKLALARALTDFALQRDDKDVGALITRAWLAGRRGEWSVAYATIERAVAIAPKSEAVLAVAGVVEARVGRLDVAKEHLARGPARYDLLVARGVAARAAGDGAGAEKQYKDAIAADGSRAEAHYDLALYYERFAQPMQKALAIAEYRRAAEIDGTLDAAARADALARP